MITLTVKYIAENYGDKATVGVLGTDGTVKSGIYQETFKKIAPEIRVLLPEAKSQIDVMKAIYDIKASSVNELNSQLLYNAAQKLIQRGASIVILGCTEIPLALSEKACNFIRIDPMELLAEKVIEKTLKSKTQIYHEEPKISPRHIEHIV